MTILPEMYSSYTSLLRSTNCYLNDLNLFYANYLVHSFEFLMKPLVQHTEIHTSYLMQIFAERHIDE